MSPHQHSRFHPPRSGRIAEAALLGVQLDTLHAQLETLVEAPARTLRSKPPDSHSPTPPTINHRVLTPPPTQPPLSACRADFPQLDAARQPLIYLDSAATTLKPRPVIDAIRRYYENSVAGVHRSSHSRGEQATRLYESARARVARFIGAKRDEIAFTRSATESLNLLARALSPCGQVAVPLSEHHANWLPWREESHSDSHSKRAAGFSLRGRAADDRGASSETRTTAQAEACGSTARDSTVREARRSSARQATGSANQQVTRLALPLDPTGAIDLARAEPLIAEHRPIAISVSLINNVTGLRAPLNELRTMARSVGARLILDLSQAVGHEPINVHELACDAAVFSAHKMLGPEGVGVLYARPDFARELTPLLLGGSMVRHVHADGHASLPFPHGFEAGSPHTAGAIGLAAACDYLDSLGVDRIQSHTAALAEQLIAGLERIPTLRRVGYAHRCPDATDALAPSALAPLVSFFHPDLDAHTIARVLSDRFQIAVRAGYHCAQPLHETCGWPETVRVSMHAYNTTDEIADLLAALQRITTFSA